MAMVLYSSGQKERPEEYCEKETETYVDVSRVHVKSTERIAFTLRENPT
eukprot:CAMPEP_0174899418 /NCGR_PEP_ID=MMETSP0167-20121228/27116_1 /TAXON_ID=38298 /ORGANISM="Rhodella maculata, Strain CCMP736" /LENGTH=48 /DNA_ID= /DNA_START= /DNA_END= /DNA_ORIENTATION=